MKLYKINIKPQGGFYTPLKGDQLFGQFCCTAACAMGGERLEEWLEGYTGGRPYIVLSDAFPQGYLPKPCLPFSYYKTDNALPDVQKRKEFKKRIWLPEDKAALPVTQMKEFFADVKFKESELKSSNNVNPLSGHADGGPYSAYGTLRTCYYKTLSIYAVADENKITKEEIAEIFTETGLQGYGKKASAGGGKFSVENIIEITPLAPQNKFMTLAPCVPQPEILDADECFYKIFVRFGRHGGAAARSGIPFKKPVITADTGAVLTFKDKSFQALFTGQGISGVSPDDRQTVFQGYAPVIPLNAEEYNR